MNDEILSLYHVSLSENGNEELREVTFSLYEGDILGLISLDNQGLSALLDLIINSRHPDCGHLVFQGAEVSGSLEHSVKRNKAVIIEAKSHLFPSLSIAENFFSVKQNGAWIINRKKQNLQIRLIFEPYGVNLTGNERPDSLSLLDRCRVEIIKAKTLGFKVIILQDLSSFLGPKEIRCVQELIRQIAEADGIAFLYLCNHHQEIASVCTRLIIMYSGIIILNKDIKSVTPKMMTVISNDSIKSVTRLRKPFPPVYPEELAVIAGTNGFNLPVSRGECVVLLDLDNKAVPQISDALFSRRSLSYRIFIEGKDACLYPQLWSFIPADPIENFLFPTMSYIDNLTLRNFSSKLPLFWVWSRYRKHISAEYREKVGSVIDNSNLFMLSQRELYELIYMRPAFERPKILFIVQPFSRLDMYQRMHILKYISALKRKGITIVILAISLSDSLKVATRLVLLQNHHIEREFTPDNFDKAAEYGLIVR